MRKNQTTAERKLWQQIRRRQVHGVKFRRQHVIDHIIVDFCSLSIRLIIEVDGPSHEDSQEADVLRQSVLESYGFEVVRLTNQDVLSNLEGVLGILYDVVERRKTPP
jgi:very-short-patch-repair endonuclease